MNKKLKNITKEIRVVRMGDLKLYPGNPRRNNKSAKVVAKSIKEYGYINPIVATDDLTIIAGNTRFKALKYLGLEENDEIDVLVIKGLTEEQIRGFVIADNRAGEFSQWNYSAVERMMSDGQTDTATLKEMGMSSFADNKKDLEDLINA